MFCSCEEQLDNTMWKSLHLYLGDKSFSQLILLPVEDQIVQLMVGFPLFDMDDKARVKLFKISVRYIHAKAYKLRYMLI